MPQPTMSDVHVDRALTDLSVRFTQSMDRFVADRVFPRVPVQHRSDKYYVYDRSYWYKTDAQLRAPATESAGSGFEFTTDSYLTAEYAIHKDIDDMTLANADSPLTLDRDATEFVTTHIMQKKEEDWVSTFFTTGVWNTDSTPSNTWDDYVSGDPIGDLRAGVIAMEELTAYTPNTLVMGPEVWDKLQDHPDFLDRIKYTQTGIMGPQLLATMLGLDRVLVPRAVRNTSAEGETAAYDFHFGKNALLCYVPSSAGLNTPAAGYTFTWTGYPGTGSRSHTSSRWAATASAWSTSAPPGSRPSAATTRRWSPRSLGTSTTQPLPDRRY